MLTLERGEGLRRREGGNLRLLVLLYFPASHQSTQQSTYLNKNENQPNGQEQQRLLPGPVFNHLQATLRKNK